MTPEHAPPDDGKLLKIQIVISSLGFGGAERVASLLANAWCRMGHEVLMTLFDSPRSQPAYAIDSGVKRVALDLLKPSKGTFDAITKNIRRILTLRNNIGGFSPDVIVSFMVESNVLTVLANLFLNNAVIISEHTDPLKYSPGRAWSFLRKRTYPRAAYLVVLTESAKKYFYHSVKGHVCVIPNPIICDRKKIVNDQDGISSTGTIVTIGRLCKEKRFDFLLKVFSKISGTYPGWNLIILGEGLMRDDLEALIDDLNLTDRVSLPGLVTNPHSVLSTADIFVSTSVLEGFPMAICEAMACGLPVVAVEYNESIFEIIEQDISGIVVKPDDAGMLQKVLGELISNPDMRLRLGADARRIETRYGIDVATQKWDVLFEQLRAW